MTLGHGKLAWRNLLAAGLVIRMLPLLVPDVTSPATLAFALVGSVGIAVWVLRGGPWALLIGTYAAVSGLSLLMFAFVLPTPLAWALAGLISIPTSWAGWRALRTPPVTASPGAAAVSGSVDPAASRRRASGASPAASQPGAPNVRRRSQAQAGRPRGRDGRAHR